MRLKVSTTIDPLSKLLEPFPLQEKSIRMKTTNYVISRKPNLQTYDVNRDIWIPKFQ